jgi:phosphoglycerol transferase MdoB-like AlkP superfamily enzyme
MSLFRLIFFLHFKGNLDTTNYIIDIIESFFLGLRVDLTVVGYIYALAFIISAIFYIFKRDFFQIFKYYYFIFFIIILLLLGADFGFYSYFKEHINILFFGLFDDDTSALMVTFWQNYNVLLIVTLFTLLLVAIFKLINKIFSFEFRVKERFLTKQTPLLFFTLLLLIFLMIRGTFGMYPLGKMLPNISKSPFINQAAQNAIRRFARAYEQREAFKSNHYNLIAKVGYQNNMEKAFKIHTQKDTFETQELLNNITFQTPKDTQEGLNVVLIMVESFGMPILKYNSDKFDLLGEMQQHFKEDTLFTHFISAGDGTISSLESLILNITFRPNSFPFSQSPQKQTHFDYTPAFLYNKKGYESSFIYGGDLTWRDIGSFIKNQGYKIEGKIDIYKNIKKNKNYDYFHPWGIYDEFLYEHIEKKLQEAKKPQFIVALSTNNHPPYTIPKQYQSKELTISDDLKHHLTGDLKLAKKRFYSYQYAIDQVGRFLTQIKNSSLSKNTIVVITADNNTIDGIMKYDENRLFNSKNIPLLLYLPPKVKERVGTIDSSIYGSHKDIFPTLYNLTLRNTPYQAIGADLLNPKLKHIGFNGSMVVSSKEETVKLNSFSEKSKNPLKEYYKATLAVEEYLINQYKD